MMTQRENAVTVRAHVSHDPVIPLLPLIPHAIRYSDRRRVRTNRMIATTNLQNIKKRRGNCMRNVGRGSIGVCHEDRNRTRPGPRVAGSDLGQVRDLRARQLNEVEGAQLDAEASAPA